MESIQTAKIMNYYKVVVGCTTYNHSKYIVDALNGFAMQKTQFPFACIVMDDASTDGEQEVIGNWLREECDLDLAENYDLELANVVIAPHKSNSNCTMFVYFLKRNLYKEQDIKYGMLGEWVSHSEYLALCEGDDYWTDPEKLQIQADCLDAHPEVDMCAHSYREVSAISGKTIKHIHRRKEDCIIPAEDIIAGGGDFLATDSIIYRLGLENNIPAFRRYMNIDYTLCIHGALRGGLFYINREMSVYRKEVPDSWNDRMKKNVLENERSIDNLLNMLEILDGETKMYHRCIREVRFEIEANAIRHFIYSQNTAIENIKKLSKYKGGIHNITITEKINVAFKCICPRVGKRIQNFFNR